MSIAGKPVGKGVYEFPYVDTSKRNLTGWQKFKLFLWNPDTKEVLDRPMKLWAYSLIFYVIFYIVLAAMFAICMKCLLWNLDRKQPKFQLEESIIGINPGLGYRPMPIDIDEGALIWFEAKNDKSVKRWVETIDEFLAEYQQTQDKTIALNRMPCNYTSIVPEGRVCDVSLNHFGPCNRNNNYGFSNSSPCIFLKLNRIFSWVPDFYTAFDTLPNDMPEDLKQNIKSSNGTGVNNIWISCAGQNPVDKEHIGASFSYYPAQGFPSYYYPFVNSPGYLSPLVAVKINRPTTNVIINIECRAWAKNINYHGGKNREGSVHFEMLID